MKLLRALWRATVLLIRVCWDAAKDARALDRAMGDLRSEEKRRRLGH